MEQTWLLQVAESSGSLASAVFFLGPHSYTLVSAPDAGIFVCSGRLAQHVREARVHNTTQIVVSLLLVVLAKVTHMRHFCVFLTCPGVSRAGVHFLGPSITHSCE